MKVDTAEQSIVMDTLTFQRLRRVLLNRTYNTLALSRSEYKDLQKVIAWMDNVANWQLRDRREVR